RDQLAGLAVQDVEESVAVGLEQRRDLLTVDLDVGQHVFVDAVVVPGVVRRRLVVPRELAGVRVDGPGAGREEVREVAVAGAVRAPHGGIPWARIAGAVVDEVERGIVGPDRPRRGAAVLPRVALSRVVARLTRP